MYNEEFKDKIKEDLKKSLSSHRYTHVLGVAAAARELADRYGCDADTAEVAGLLHDAAKQLPLPDMQALAEKSFPVLPAPILANGGLLHGYAAVTIARERYGITDQALLGAIAHHTTGAEQMSTLEKIIFLADYIEVNRDFDGVDDLRKAARRNLDPPSPRPGQAYFRRHRRQSQYTDRHHPCRRSEGLRMTQEKRRKILYRILTVVAAVAVFLAGRSLYLHYQSIKEAPIQQDAPDTSQTQSDSSVFAQTSPDKPLYVLLLGTDGGHPQQANFVGVAAINKAKKHIDIIMLPDDTKIEGRKEKGIQELQDVYSEGGMSLVRAVVEDIFHIPIPYYATFTVDSFSKMVDMSGGVPIYVEKNMYHGNEETGKTDINLFQGYQTLTGKEAAGYMRYVDGDGYLSRTQRQERFIKNFYEDRQDCFGVTNAFFLYRAWHDVDSNISAKDMAQLAFDFRGVTADNIDFYILPGEMAMSGKNGDTKYYWTYDPVEVQKVIGRTNNAISTAPEPDDTKK